MEFEDVTGTPRPQRDIEAALYCIKTEMVKNPMAMSKSGEPLMIHYIVIKDAIEGQVEVRDLVERARAAAAEGRQKC